MTLTENIYSRTNSFQAIGGNIMTASPISDLNPVFMAARCTLTLASAGGNVPVMGFKMYLNYTELLITKLAFL